MNSPNHYAENLEESLLGRNPPYAKRKPLTAGNDQGRIGYGLGEPLTNGLRR